MIHPGRLTAGTYSHHPFRKENDLNQTSMIMVQPLIFQGVRIPPIKGARKLQGKKNRKKFESSEP